MSQQRTTITDKCCTFKIKKWNSCRSRRSRWRTLSERLAKNFLLRHIFFWYTENIIWVDFQYIVSKNRLPTNPLNKNILNSCKQFIWRLKPSLRKTKVRSIIEKLEGVDTSWGAPLNVLRSSASHWLTRHRKTQKNIQLNNTMRIVSAYSKTNDYRMVGTSKKGVVQSEPAEDHSGTLWSLHCRWFSNFEFHPLTSTLSVITKKRDSYFKYCQPTSTE